MKRWLGAVGLLPRWRVRSRPTMRRCARSRPAVRGSIRAPTSASSASRSAARSCCRRSQSAPWRDLLPQHAARAPRGNFGREPARARRAGAAAPSDADACATRRSRETLAPVLAELGEQGPAGRDALGALQALAQAESSRDRKDDDEPAGSRSWSRQFQTSEGVARAITYVGYALVVALVLFVIWSELRAAGSAGRRAPRRPPRRVPAAEWRRRLMLTDVLAAPLADRPGMLLRLLGEALTRAQRLPAAEGLTAARHRAPRAPRFGRRSRRARAGRRDRRAACATPRSRRPTTQLEGTVTARAKPCSGNLRACAAGKR